MLLPFIEPAARQIVRISVDDENDNPPHFMQPLFSGGMQLLFSGGMEPLFSGGMEPLFSGGMEPLFSGGMEHTESYLCNLILKIHVQKYSKSPRRSTSQ